MKAQQLLLVLGLLALISTAGFVRAQAPPESDDGNSDTVENDGGRGEAENDGNDGDDTSVGANPPTSLVGCLSPFTYLASQPGLGLFRTATEVVGFEDVLKYRNVSGTIFAPTNNALRNYGAAAGVDIDRPSTINRALLRSILQYHVVFDSIDPTTLAALQNPTSYDTALAVTPTGSNAKLDSPATTIFQRDSTSTYENLTIVVAPLGPGVDSSNAPNGTYKVQGGASTGNIIWDATNEPVRTCVGYLYKVDGVLLPAASTQTLSEGAPAPTGAEEGDGNDGAAPPTEDDGGNEGSSTEGA